MRIALCISGEFRSFGDNWLLIKQNLIRDYEFDIFAYHPKDDQASRLLDYPIKSLQIQDPPYFSDAFCKLYRGPDRSWYTVSPVQAHLRRLWGVYACDQLRIQEENLQGFKYDFVIRSRYDLQFTNELERFEDLDPTGIYFPKHDNWGGYNDRFAIGSSSAMKQYSSAFFSVQEHHDLVGYIHSEPHLKWHIDRSGEPVRRIDILFNTVRHNDCWMPNFHEHLGDVL